MKKQLLLAFAFVFISCQVQAQTEKPWASHKGALVAKHQSVERAYFPEDFKLYEVDVASLKKNLSGAVDRFSKNKRAALISLPNVDGNSEKFEVFEASNFDAALQAQFPDI